MVVLLSAVIASAEPPTKPRLLVLTDIGGDPDDQQSMIRLMLYANEFEMEGLIASAAGTPGELKEAVTKKHLIREIVEAYGRVRDNLAHHANGYPTAEELLGRIRSGNPHRGFENIGEGHDTEGSNWIIATADKPDPRPLNVTIWGGQTDLAQALWRVRQGRGTDGLRKFVSQLRVYDISDQDKIQGWIQENFHDLFYLLAKAPAGRDKREGAYRGIYLGGDESLTSRAWIDAHVRLDHGPLGALYPTKTWTEPNPHSTLKEGDTPSWFYFLPNRLSDPTHPEWGGWGGRFERAKGNLYRDAHDTIRGVTDARATVWRWRADFQNDFAGRMDWCVKPRTEANHPPNVRVSGELLRRTAPGERVVLDASDSTDPDGHKLAYDWWFYKEPGNYEGDLTMEDRNLPRTTIIAPRVTQLQTVHIVLTVRDSGTPPLVGYTRVVLAIDPAAQRREKE